MKLSLLVFLLLMQGNSFADTLFERQWGFKNNGQTLLLDRDQFSRDEIQGVPGMDIEWTDIDVPSHRKAIVAVLDTGVDIFHPDLEGRFWQNEKTCAEKPESREAIIQNACHGYNAFKENGDVTDDDGHGTHIAGIIAAQQNSIGVRGLAHPNVEIMPIKVLDPIVESYIYTEENRRKLITSVIANGITFAINNGADVINLSLGFPSLVETPSMRAAIQLARANDVAIVSAAGNNNKEIPIFPCTYEDVICVGSYGVDGKYSEFSNFGGKVDILAPGDQIVSTYPSEEIESSILRIKGYETLKGTSQSAPFISAILANMRLMDPRIRVDQMKAKLFSSARPIASSSKKSKFARASMKRALEANPEKFISPTFKNLLDIKYNYATKAFQFNLPLKNYLRSVENIEVNLRLSGQSVLLDQNNFSIERISSGQTHTLEVSGKVINEADDNNVELTVDVKSGSFEQTVSTTLMFARELAEDKIQIIEGIDTNGFLAVGQLRSFLTGNIISDPKRLLGNPVIYRERKEGADIFVDLISISKAEQKVKTIKLEGYNQLLGIFANDTNLDGEPDYFFYGMDQNRRQLIFEFRDREGEKLISDHQWFLPISEFEGLPLSKQMRAENFFWLKTKTSLGNFLLPAIYKYFETPELDRTDDFLNERPAERKRHHLYYFTPEKENGVVNVNLRVINSDDFIDDLIERFRLPWNTLINLEEPNFQSSEMRRKGEIYTLVSVGEHAQKRYFSLYILDSNQVSMMEVRGQNEISNNALFEITGLPSDDTVSTGYVRRNNMRNDIRIDAGDLEQRSVQTLTWSDPIFEVIAGFNQSGNNIYFIDSRYSVHGLYGDQQFTLPINRDSSFRKVQFTESFAPMITKRKDRLSPSLFVDSTMIFGDRLYAMVLSEEGMVRPFSTSLGIPSGCVHLLPQKMQGDDFHSYVLLCKRENKLGIAIVPMNVE